jgi:hypothetical protein
MSSNHIYLKTSYETAGSSSANLTIVKKGNILLEVRSDLK